MPWNAAGFRKHNQSLSLQQAQKGASIANAVMKTGKSDGQSIAIANAQLQKMRMPRAQKSASPRLPRGVIGSAM